MRKNKKAVVFFGPDAAFADLLKRETSDGEKSADYLESIRIYNAKIRASDLAAPGAKVVTGAKVDNCIVRSNDYGSVLSHVIANFVTVLEDAFDFQTAYVQNPPVRVLNSLVSAYGPEAVDLEYYEYKSLGKHDIPRIYDELCRRIFGQQECKRSLIAALYRLYVMSDGAPSVILFYGPSGVGKTETAKVLSDAVGDGKLTRIQFSMMQTNEAYEYLFGAEHSKASFSRDLLCRESNIVLIDEFDKVQPALYNMFYQLFDEGRYVDTNYDVDMRGSLFILTSNFASESEARRAMGSAIFSRIDACVGFDDLSVEEKKRIAKGHFDFIVEKLDSDDKKAIESSDIAGWFAANANRYDNMRIMKAKIEEAIFELLSQSILSDSCDSDSLG